MLMCTLNMMACSQNTHMKEEALSGKETKYFSNNYIEARKKFLNVSYTVGATVESFQNPNTGPDGGPLFTDVALIGPKDARTILVLMSGTHGVEASADQASKPV